MININGKPLAEFKTTFPNGEVGYNIDLTKTYFPEGNLVVWLKFCYDVDTVSRDLMDLFFVSAHLKSKGFIIKLSLGYAPFSRMDRTKHGNEVFTLKHFADLINKMGFAEVYILDPHSDVTPALFNNVRVSYPISEVEYLVKKLKIDFVCYPDSGALKKYSSIYEYPFIYGVKNRDWKTGKITSFEINTCGHDLKGKNILIVDDICSKGGTFVATADALMPLGVKEINLFVTHCEPAISEGSLVHATGSAIRHVYYLNALGTIRTNEVYKDTIYEDKHKVSQIDITDEVPF